jgi:hypothetical protein
MARRREGWNVGLAHDRQDSKFAREFLSAVEEGFSVQVALGKVVRAMDEKEGAVGQPECSACDQPRHNASRTRSSGSCDR